MTYYPSKEYELIRRIQGVLPPVNPQSLYEETIGDDAAVRVNSIAGERLIITADIAVEGIHFTLGSMTLEEIGYKSMVANLSDCAAMGALPDSAVVQVVFPKNLGYRVDVDNAGIDTDNSGINTDRPRINPNQGLSESIEQLYAGFARACKRWDFPIVGGDMSSGGAWVIGITLIGAISRGNRAVRRTGIKEGDALWVTGIPGESAAGLAAIRRWGRGGYSAQRAARSAQRTAGSGVPAQYARFVDAHVSPSPRIAEGQILAADPFVHAMMDLSDGLSKDVATLCFDNNLGFVFDCGADKCVPPEMMSLASELGSDYKDWFYHGGEEYELLAACGKQFDPNGINGVELICLGHFTSESSKVLVRGDDGAEEELPHRSWDHCSTP